MPCLAFWFDQKLSTDIEGVQKCCLKLVPILSYTEAPSKSNLDHLGYHCDVITQNVFRQIKDPKHPLHYLLPPVKVSKSKMVLQATYPCQLPLDHLPKLLVMDEILFHTTFPRSLVF